LIDGDERRHAAAFEVFGTNRVAGAFRGDHDDVDVLARNDLVVVDVEAVREAERRAFLEVGFHGVAVDLRDDFVGHQHHHDVGAFHRLGDFLDLESGGLGLLPRIAVLEHADGDFHAGVVQVLRVGVALRAVADDGDFLAFDEGEVGVFVVIDFHDVPFRGGFRV